MHPDDAGHNDEGHGRENHHTIVHIPCVVPPLREDLITHQSAAAEELAEEGYDDEDDAVAQAVADSVKEGGPGAVVEGECLKTTHDDTVGDDEADKDGERLAHLIVIRLQHLIHYHHKRSHD